MGTLKENLNRFTPSKVDESKKLNFKWASTELNELARTVDKMQSKLAGQLPVDTNDYNQTMSAFNQLKSKLKLTIKTIQGLN